MSLNLQTAGETNHQGGPAAAFRMERYCVAETGPSEPPATVFAWLVWECTAAVSEVHEDKLRHVAVTADIQR
jgi:hypothetical protein